LEEGDVVTDPKIGVGGEQRDFEREQMAKGWEDRTKVF